MNNQTALKISYQSGVNPSSFALTAPKYETSTTKETQKQNSKT